MKLTPKLKAMPEAFYKDNENDEILITDKDGKLLKGCGAYAQYLGIYAALKGLKGLKALKAPDNTLDDKDYKLAVMHFGSCKKCKAFERLPRRNRSRLVDWDSMLGF